MQQKKYEELAFADDFIFWKVLTTHIELCRELLEIILDREIVKIVYAHPQKTIEESSDARGVRLDGGGLPLYTFENICREQPALQLNDESCKIFVNGTANNISGKLGELIRYLSGQVTGTFSKSLDNAVTEVRQSKDGRREYMTLFMRDIMKREEGLAEGLSKGRKIMIINMLKAGATKELIYACGVTEEELAEAEKEVLQQA